MKTQRKLPGLENNGNIGRIRKAENGKYVRFRRRFLRWIRLLFDHNSMKSRQSSQHQMSVNSEIELYVSRPIKVDKRSAGSSGDTEESPMSDENS